MIIFIRLSLLVSVCKNVNKKREDGRFLFTFLHKETKQLSRIKKIIYFHYQYSLPDLTPSATKISKHFDILTWIPKAQMIDRRVQ